jgi:hypothetical protein
MTNASLIIAKYEYYANELLAIARLGHTIHLYLKESHKPRRKLSSYGITPTYRNGYTSS